MLLSAWRSTAVLSVQAVAAHIRIIPSESPANSLRPSASCMSREETAVLINCGEHHVGLCVFV
eukprot:724464-Pyramimonas_sp.AAC.1